MSLSSFFLPTDSWQPDDEAAAMHSNFTQSEEILDTEENQNIYEQLTCALCLEPYQDPRILDCCHSFCRKCLVNVVTKQLSDPENPLGVYPCTIKTLQLDQCREHFLSKL